MIIFPPVDDPKKAAFVLNRHRYRHNCTPCARINKPEGASAAPRIPPRTGSLLVMRKCATCQLDRLRPPPHTRPRAQTTEFRNGLKRQIRHRRSLAKRQRPLYSSLDRFLHLQGTRQRGHGRLGRRLCHGFRRPPFSGWHWRPVVREHRLRQRGNGRRHRRASAPHSLLLDLYAHHHAPLRRSWPRSSPSWRPGH